MSNLKREHDAYEAGMEKQYEAEDAARMALRNDDEAETCSTCDGSGEGQQGGTCCEACNGSGETAAWS